MERTLTGLFELDLYLFAICDSWRVKFSGRRISRWHYANIIMPPIPEWCKYLRSFKFLDFRATKNDQYNEHIRRRTNMVDILENYGWPLLDFADGPLSHPWQVPAIDLNGVGLWIRDTHLRLHIMEKETPGTACFSLGTLYGNGANLIYSYAEVMLFNQSPSCVFFWESPLFSSASDLCFFCKYILPCVMWTPGFAAYATLRCILPRKYWHRLALEDWD